MRGQIHLPGADVGCLGRHAEPIAQLALMQCLTLDFLGRRDHVGCIDRRAEQA